MKKYLLTILFLLIATTTSAAPLANVFRSLLPENNNEFYLGSTTPKAYWKNIYTYGLTVSNGTATTTLNAGDSLATFAYPFTPTTHLGSTRSATTSDLFTNGAGFYSSGASVLGTTSITVLNIGTAVATGTLRVGGGVTFLSTLSVANDTSTFGDTTIDSSGNLVVNGNETVTGTL